MKRRQLLLGLGAASLGGCVFGGPPKLDFSLAAPTGVRIDTRKPGAALDDSMLGLSFDTAALAEPQLLTAESPQLIGLLHGLGQHGVLRFGGRSLRDTLWQRDGGTVKAPYKHSVSASDIDRLANLVDSIGWQVIYGLDIGHGNPARAADEAGYVYSRIGKRVLAFELGDAPDRYASDGLRPRDYNAAAASAEWLRYATAVRHRVPGAALAGPGIADVADTVWTGTFVDTCRDQLHLLTAQVDSHEGRGHRQRYGSLAGHVFGLDDEQQAGLDHIAATAKQTGLPCRITQARAEAGRHHGVDTLGAALWALDLFYQRCGNAAAPWAGVCFHDVLSLASEGSSATLNAGPLYYAMRLLALTLPGRKVDAAVVPPPIPGAKPDAKPPESPLHSHALLDRNGKLQLVLINTDANNSLDVRVSADRALNDGSILRLAGPTLDAASQVTLASGSADAQGDWRPQYTDTAQVDGGAAYLTVSAGSAALVLFD